MEHLVYQDRRGTNCVKWDVLGKKYQDPDLLSMWIADADFRCPECVVNALTEYVEQGVFGYYLPPSGCEQAFIDWEQTQHGFHIEPSWLRFSPGGVAALHIGVTALTKPGDVVAVMPPVYPAFFSAPKSVGRDVAPCPLKKIDGRYVMDLDGLERIFAEKGARLLIHCSPHNPVGRVWSQEELLALLKLCEKYDVTMLSDEVHQDLCQPGFRFISVGMFPEFADRVVCITSPAKTFNLAGCGTATMIIPGEENRKKIDAALHLCGISKGSAFSYVATKAVYTGGKAWLSALLAQVRENEAVVRTALSDNVPGLEIAPLEGTFLLWLDFTRLIAPEEFKRFLTKECGLALNYGEEFGGADYCCCARMNLATSKENVQLAVERILTALRARSLCR